MADDDDSRLGTGGNEQKKHRRGMTTHEGRSGGDTSRVGKIYSNISE